MSAGAVLTEDSATLLSFRPAQFAMDIAPDCGRAEVCARGEVDLATCDALTEIGLLAVRRESVAEVVIDLGSVTFFDASGLGSLVAIRNASRDHGKNLVLRNVPARIMWLLEITELLELFPVATASRADRQPPLDAISEAGGQTTAVRIDRPGRPSKAQAPRKDSP